MTQAEYNEHIEHIKEIREEYLKNEDVFFLCTIATENQRETIDNMLFNLRDQMPKFACIKSLLEKNLLFLNLLASKQQHRAIRIKFLNKVLDLHKQGKLLDLLNS